MWLSLFFGQATKSLSNRLKQLFAFQLLTVCGETSTSSVNSEKIIDQVSPRGASPLPDGFDLSPQIQVVAGIWMKANMLFQTEYEKPWRPIQGWVFPHSP